MRRKMMHALFFFENINEPYLNFSFLSGVQNMKLKKVIFHNSAPDIIHEKHVIKLWRMESLAGLAKTLDN